MEQPCPSVNCQNNSDGSVDVYFGLAAPMGKENKWARTVPGKGWFTLVRFYGPLKPHFQKDLETG